MITSESPSSSCTIQRVDQLVAVRRAHLDAVELDRAVVARLDQHVGSARPSCVGVDQPVQPDDRRAEAGECVVVVAEERQRVLDVAERRRGLA